MLHLRRVLLIFSIYFIPSVYAAEKPSPAIITEEQCLERMKKDIFFLAGEDCEGRGLSTKGIIKAGEYIADAFKQAGLKPAGDKESYYQPFTVAGPGKVQPGATIAFTGPDDKTLDLKIGTDARPTIASTSGKSTAEIVFVGYGLRSKEQKYDDYADIDVKGKVVVVLRRTPRADDKKKPFDPSGQLAPLNAKLETASERGAAGVIIVSDRGTAGEQDPLMEEGRTQGSSLKGPVVHVKRAIVDQLLAAKKKTLKEIEEKIDETGLPQSFAIEGWKIASDLTVKRTEYPTRNIVGVLPGAGPLADETIVIGAHYDHLGKGDEGSSLDRNPVGKVHYGADDNGSGTTGLLEMARRYGAQKNRVGRRIVFIAFSGEEKGLFGSLHYVKNPTFPLDKTVFMLNMDMIGRMKGIQETGKDDAVAKDRLVIYGTGTTPDMNALVDKFTKPFDYKLYKIEGGSGPSDHTSFYAKKIPVLFFFTGTHSDYHKPTDTPDKINLKGLKKVLDTAELFANYFATVEKRPEYRATKGGSEDPTNPNRSSISVPRIGIMPGNYGDVDGGVLVEEVMPEGPAAKAGMKQGDRIIDINGKAIKNMDSYMTAMGAQKPGVEIPVIVVRGEKKLTLKVLPNPPPK